MSARRRHQYDELRGKHILLVENDPQLAKIITEMLQQYDHPFHVTSGMQMLERILSEAPDIIVLDLKLPAMSGLEAVKALRLNKKSRGIPILAISESTAERVKCMSAGCDDFILKPFGIHRLLDRLVRLVRIDQPFRL